MHWHDACSGLAVTVELKVVVFQVCQVMCHVAVAGANAFLPEGFAAAFDADRARDVVEGGIDGQAPAPGCTCVGIEEV